jgi:PAS domain S-box-containing protein
MDATSLNHLFMQAPVAVCIVSGADYKIELVNERMLQFLGRTPDVVGQPIEQTLTEAKRQGLISILDTVSQTKQPYYVSNFPAVILINGVREIRHFSLIFKPYFLKQGDKEPEGIFCVAHNITDQILTLQKLEEEKSRTSLALEVGELGMLSTHWKNNIANADKRTNEIFGFTESHPLEDYISRIHPEDRSVREQAIREAINTGSFDFFVRIRFADDNIRWMRSRGMIQKDIEGNVTGSFGVVQDVTRQKEFELALQKKVEGRTMELELANKSLLQLNEELLRSNTSLEEFTRAASHDLKEPIRKVDFFVERLKTALENKISNEERLLFERVENATDRMRLLIDDLLEYSHLTQSQRAQEKIDLNDKVRLILTDLELMIREKNATIDVDKLPIVKGHRRQLQQLFQNLISNSLKYSKPGTVPYIQIKSKEIVGGDAPVSISPEDASQKFYLIEVCDNGIGFDQTDAERIFNVFTRLHGNKEYPGTGIGLSIAKKVVENHHGYIYAKGETGKGACFNVLLPAQV